MTRQSTLRTAKTATVSHAKLQNQGSRVLGHSLQDLMHRGDELRGDHTRITVTVSVLLQSPARVNTKAIEVTSKEAMLAPVEQVVAEVPRPADNQEGRERLTFENT